MSPDADGGLVVALYWIPGEAGRAIRERGKAGAIGKAEEGGTEKSDGSRESNYEGEAGPCAGL